MKRALSISLLGFVAILIGLPSWACASAESPAPLETIQGKYIHAITIDQAVEKILQAEAEKEKEKKPINMTSRNAQPLSHPNDKDVMTGAILLALDKLSDEEVAMVFLIASHYEQAKSETATLVVEPVSANRGTGNVYISMDMHSEDSVAYQTADTLVDVDAGLVPETSDSEDMVTEPDDALYYLYDLAKKIVDHGLDEARDYVKNKYGEIRARHLEISLYDRVHSDPSISDFSYTAQLIPEAYAEDGTTVSSQTEKLQPVGLNLPENKHVSSASMHPYLKVMVASENGNTQHLDLSQVEDAKNTQEAELLKKIKNAEYYKKIKERILEKIAVKEMGNVDISDRIKSADDLQPRQTK